MDIQALRQKTPQELDVLLTDARARLTDFRFQLRAHELKQTHVLRDTRRMIARILTVLHERKSAVSSQQSAAPIAA